MPQWLSRLGSRAQRVRGARKSGAGFRCGIPGSACVSGGWDLPLGLGSAFGLGVLTGSGCVRDPMADAGGRGW